MAAITWSDVTGVAEELAAPATPIAAQTLFLAIVNGAGVAVNVFGGEAADLTKAARIFLAAHLDTLRRRRGLGAIASQSEGGASQSYWMGFTSPRMLHLTGWGQALAQLAMGTPARAGLLLG
jgi:hypothetical protein